MSVRLRLASMWTPRFLMAREVERIRTITNTALDGLLASHGSRVPGALGESASGSLEGRRKAMAEGHVLRVEALVGKMGREEAIRAAREALHATGVELGREARARLGVGDSREDLVRAAKVMYRVLGIEFVVTNGPEGDRLTVSRCALSEHYSRDACAVLSAVDEGAVSGLSPGASMLFERRMTDGCSRCEARIEFGEGI